MAEDNTGVPNKRKRKQKLESKTNTIDDEILFDVQLQESSGSEFVTDSSESEEQSIVKSERTRTKRYRSIEVKQEFEDTTSTLSEAVKRLRRKEQIKSEFVKEDQSELVIEDRDEAGFKLYREAYVEMDEKETYVAWNALAPREHNLWRKRGQAAKNKDKKENIENLMELSTNIGSDDLDLPDVFPDASVETRKLLLKFAEKLSEIKEIQLIFNSNLEKRVKDFRKLTELQKYFFDSVHNNDNVAVNHKYVIERYLSIRKSFFNNHFKSPAMKISSHFDKQMDRDTFTEIDDFVYVKSVDRSKVQIARIKEKYMNGRVIVGRLFVEIDPVEIEHIYPIYRNNVIMVCDGSEFKFKSVEILGRCIVLNFSDYITARPTDIPEQDVYFCTHIKTYKRLLRPLVIDELTNVLDTYPGELYYFKFDGTEDLVHDNQIIWESNIKEEPVMTEESYDEPVVNSEIEFGVPVKQEIAEDMLMNVITPDDNETELIIPERCEYFEEEEDPKPNTDDTVEIILYDDTTNTINLADTEDVLFVVDKNQRYSNDLDDDEVIELD